MAYSYSAYGLSIHSPLALPELVAGGEAADVIIRLGRVSCPPLETTDSKGWLKTAGEEVGFFHEEVGAFLVRGGAEILVDPVPGVEEHVLRLFILGMGLGLLLRQRGHLVLHASAVEIEGSATAFLGWKGIGKSTMAAALYERGHGIVTDDVLALDFGGAKSLVVLPAFPQLKLWPEAAAAVGNVPDALPRLGLRLEKRSRRAERRFPQKPLPLKCIYVLATGPAPGIEPLQPRDAFVELVGQSYLVRSLRSTSAASLHFRQCTQLVNCVSIRLLKTNRSLAALPDLAQMVERDAADVG